MITTSFFELFKIGPGPSSSHTVGPMLAAKRFRQAVNTYAALYGQHSNYQIRVELYGSLAATGHGHGTHRAVLAGLYGYSPTTVNVNRLNGFFETPNYHYQIPFEGFALTFTEADIFFSYHNNPHGHPNTVRFILVLDYKPLFDEVYYSVGGGFIEKKGETIQLRQQRKPKYAYHNMDSLLALHKKNGVPVDQMLLENEMALNNWEVTKVFSEIDKITKVMYASVERGLHKTGTLPGGLGVQRRAKDMMLKATQHFEKRQYGAALFARLNAYALATSEENAAGQMVVTAPTNGAAGVIPACLMYLCHDCAVPHRVLQRALLIAAMVGFIIKENAAISGAELGCQAEVGSAAAMAAALFAYCHDADIYTIVSAAEIAMEHHLGMTCDPIKGLVQVPCIERNANGAIKAYNAYLLATGRLNSEPIISFDQVVEVMRQTGKDLSYKYKETAQGGLATAADWWNIEH